MKDVIDCPMVLLTVNAKVVVRGGDGRGKENEEDEKNAEKKRAALPAKLYRYEETDETFKPIAYGIFPNKSVSLYHLGPVCCPTCNGGRQAATRYSPVPGVATSTAELPAKK